MSATPEQLRDDYTFAFQPIVDVENHTVWAYEALVRGPGRESAASVIEQFPGRDLLAFDQAARVRALELAASLGFDGRLTVNMLNESLSGSRNVLAETMEAAHDVGFTSERVTVEVSEKDQIRDLDSFLDAIRSARSQGMGFALDDFGAGFSGLNLLAGFQPDFIKLDILLVKDIWKSGPRQAIVRGVMSTCTDLGVEVIAEGIEQPEEFEWLWDVGCRMYQGFLFARPGFESFPEPHYPPVN